MEIQTVDFGEHPASACLADTSYRINYITIVGDPCVGILKCMDKSNTRTRCFMPLTSWHSMINDVLPKMTYPPMCAQPEVSDRYPSSLYKHWFPSTFISEFNIFFTIIIIFIIWFKTNGLPKGKSEQDPQQGMKSRTTHQIWKLSPRLGETSRKCLCGSFVHW